MGVLPDLKDLAFRAEALSFVMPAFQSVGEGDVESEPPRTPVLSDNACF
jgi:hypothetical protein